MPTKMDKVWIAAAILTKEGSALFDLDSLKTEYKKLFSEEYPSSIEQQITSWKRRYFDPNRPTQGGSRNRYLFRTADGETPNNRGNFRLFREADATYDGDEKAGGATHPLKEKIPASYHHLLDWYTSDYNSASTNYAEWIEKKILESNIEITERLALAKARIGQGKFKDAVSKIMSACPFTGISDLSLLRASHIKPWAVCNNHERLDGQNGLMLSPHLDALFDKGLISFDDDGKMIACRKALQPIQAWHIDTSVKLLMSNKTKDLMAYHRQHIFQNEV